MQPTNDLIVFYSHDPSKYDTMTWRHCFSNFSPHPLQVNDKVYSTSEHYFQSMKAKGTPREDEIRNAATPMRAAEMGRDRTYPLPENWDVMKEQYMLEALRAKFTQNNYCSEALLCTGNVYLEERTKNDGYWASGSDVAGGKGKNRLGYLLMQVRDELRNK